VRVVLDTNVVVSALLFGGRPSQVLLAAEGGVLQLSTSNEMLLELNATLIKTKFQKSLAAANQTVPELITEYIKICQIESHISVVPVISVDPDDDVVLATAVAASADAVITGDQHLLALGHYQGIEIMTAAQLLMKLGMP
jgi:putative PIN family toxin of toxin-antitoxin system